MDEVKFPSDLGKLIDLLRKKGVKSFKFQGMELELTQDVPQSNYKKRQEEPLPTTQEQQGYTDEQTLFWSSAGVDAPEEVQ